MRSEYICEADYLESIEQIADAVKEVKRVLKIE
jgi:hypothetical protein